MVWEQPEGLAELVPLPRVEFSVAFRLNEDGTGPVQRPASAEILVTYPEDKITIQGVIPKLAWNRDAIVMYQLEEPNHIRIQYVSLTALVPDIDIVFEQKDPPRENIAALDDFFRRLQRHSPVRQRRRVHDCC